MKKHLIVFVLTYAFINIYSQNLDSIDIDNLKYSDDCISCLHSFINDSIQNLAQYSKFKGNLKGIILFNSYGFIEDLKILEDNCGGCGTTIKAAILDSNYNFACNLNKSNKSCIIPFHLVFDTPAKTNAWMPIFSKDYISVESLKKCHPWLKNNLNSQIDFIVSSIINLYKTEYNYFEKSLDSYCKNYPKVRLKFENYNHIDTEIIYVIHKNKLLLLNDKKTNKCRVPKDFQIPIIAIKFINGQLFYFIDNIETNENKIIRLDFKQVIYEDFKNKLLEIK